VANDSPYGLSGAVFSANQERAMDVCRRVRTGTINVNSFTINIDAPLGGFKQSGIGREYGVWGVREFVEPKTGNLPMG
jgi:aldehyde dehydrogenase (NAD+)